MCTVVLLSRPETDWPLLLAANRDEKLERSWEPPGEHWADRPGLIGGMDHAGRGTWLAFNRDGVVAAVLNRSLSLGPAEGKRSRGELPLIALEYSSAGDAASALLGLDAGQWRPFNLVVADRNRACFVRGLGSGRPQAMKLAPGLHMVTAHDPDDMTSPRVARHLPRFRAAAPPVPPDWGAWRTILADRDGPAGSEINVPLLGGFGTVCASLIGLPRAGAPHVLFAPGPPDQASFRPVPG
ncbi:MAG TPA: NRDE family protein [Acetobacteraceae bacterium]|nr:NRDE family protein [Acetobacteraceae bacterium]